MNTSVIESVGPANLEKALPLIRAYQEFYQVAEISDDKNREFFSQFGEANPAGCQFLYLQNGMPIGFATVYLTYTTTIASKVAVLNDLYTLSEARGNGVGRSLIEHCRHYAARHGAARLQWVTAPTNHQAQRLYDALNTKKSDWCFYTYPVDQGGAWTQLPTPVTANDIPF